MKKLLLFVFLFIPFVLFAQETQPSNGVKQSVLQQTKNGKPNVYVFTSPTCGHCLKFKKEFLCIA